MERNMKAAVLRGKETIQIEDRPVPEIQAREVLVEVKACGICGTDIHAVFSGDFYRAGNPATRRDTFRRGRRLSREEPPANP